MKKLIQSIQSKPFYKTRRKFFASRGLTCDKCGYCKFKTKVKDKEYSCRKCGEIKKN